MVSRPLGRFAVRTGSYHGPMDTWTWVWSALFGVGLVVVAGWVFLKILEWVLPTVPRHDPNPEEDEDEVYHRFY